MTEVEGWWSLKGESIWHFEDVLNAIGQVIEKTSNESYDTQYKENLADWGTTALRLG